ncbi:MAG: DUF2905 domain-containing protein [Chitinivibrionales bacterium]|nr:DUF2905 domain-containing protein [Chitinivibrionales bacterium]
MNWTEMGRFLTIAGIVLAVLGVLFSLSDKIPFGKLPGDLHFGKSNVHVYVPITTCILLSIIITLLVNFFSKR